MPVIVGVVRQQPVFAFWITQVSQLRLQRSGCSDPRTARSILVHPASTPAGNKFVRAQSRNSSLCPSLRPPDRIRQSCLSSAALPESARSYRLATTRAYSCRSRSFCLSAIRVRRFRRSSSPPDSSTVNRAFPSKRQSAAHLAKR